MSVKGSLHESISEHDFQDNPQIFCKCAFGDSCELGQQSEWRNQGSKIRKEGRKEGRGIFVSLSRLPLKNWANRIFPSPLPPSIGTPKNSRPNIFIFCCWLLLLLLPRNRDAFAAKLFGRRAKTGLTNSQTFWINKNS